MSYDIPSGHGEPHTSYLCAFRGMPLGRNRAGKQWKASFLLQRKPRRLVVAQMVACSDTAGPRWTRLQPARGDPPRRGCPDSAPSKANMPTCRLICVQGLRTRGASRFCAIGIVSLAPGRFPSFTFRHSACVVGEPHFQLLRFCTSSHLHACLLVQSTCPWISRLHPLLRRHTSSCLPFPSRAVLYTSMVSPLRGL